MQVWRGPSSLTKNSENMKFFDNKNQKEVLLKNFTTKKSALFILLILTISGCFNSQKDPYSIKAQGVTYFYVPKSDDDKCNETMLKIAKMASESLEDYLRKCMDKGDLTLSTKAKKEICENGAEFKYLRLSEQLEVKKTIEASKAKCNWKAID